MHLCLQVNINALKIKWEASRCVLFTRHQGQTNKTCKTSMSRQPIVLRARLRKLKRIARELLPNESIPTVACGANIKNRLQTEGNTWWSVNITAVFKLRHQTGIPQPAPQRMQQLGLTTQVLQHYKTHKSTQSGRQRLDVTTLSIQITQIATTQQEDSQHQERPPSATDRQSSVLKHHQAKQWQRRCCSATSAENTRKPILMFSVSVVLRLLARAA